MIFALWLLLAATWAQAEPLRIATFNTGLERDGPGVLLRDILRGDDPQVRAVVRVLADVAPDIVALQGVDHDYDLHALHALRDVIARHGPAYPYIFARAPNAGLATGLDMDGDGRTGRAADAQGYGRFSGQGGMAILSRYPIDNAAVHDLSRLLWRDLPGALLPTDEVGQPFPSAAAQRIQRLSSVAHWIVPIKAPGGVLHLMPFHAAPHVFDGPEDRNGRRNHDEIRLWQHVLDGQFVPAPQQRFVVLGGATIDPVDGGGRKQAIRGLLADPRLHDPRPLRPEPVARHADRKGDARLHTVDWPAPGPGPLRVDYVLPSADWVVRDAAVHWPPPGADGRDAAMTASAHRLVWVDLVYSPP